MYDLDYDDILRAPLKVQPVEAAEGQWKDFFDRNHHRWTGLVKTGALLEAAHMVVQIEDVGIPLSAQSCGLVAAMIGAHLLVGCGNAINEVRAKNEANTDAARRKTWATSRQHEPAEVNKLGVFVKHLLRPW